MRSTLLVRLAAGLGFLAVGLGAFGAHGLKDLLARNGTAALWEKAVFYHFIHAIMLFVLASGAPVRAEAPAANLLNGSRRLGPWLCFFCGIILFSGSLYLLALTNVRGLGAATPFGGFSFLAGWIWLVIKPFAGTKVD